MKKLLKKNICIFLCMLIAVTSIGGVMGYAAYPQGVTEEEALNAIKGTDTLLLSAVPSLTGFDLKTALTTSIYSDKTLSNLLINLYSSLESKGSEMEMIGVNCSVGAVAECLIVYPEVYKALKGVGLWSDVELDNVKWGVSTKEGFADALSAVISPFNDILYTLLCSGEYEMNKLVTLNGANGYENAIVPLLNSFGCTELLTQKEFTVQANENKNSMLKNIMLPLLTVLENIAVAPADNLSSTLPGVAYFIQSGKFNECFNSLLSPITSNPLVEIAVFLKILDLDSLTNIDAQQIIDSFTSGENGGLKLAELDFEALAACGTPSDTGFVPDKAAAYVEIMRWIMESLKLNADALSAFSGDADISLLKELLNKDTDLLVSAIILLFNPIEPIGAQAMVYPSFIQGIAQNNTKLTDKNLEKVYNEIDDLLDQFVKDGGSYSSIGSLIRCSLYKNSTLNSLVLEIYKALEKEGVCDALKLLGMDVTPQGVAALLTESDYKNAATTLKSAKSWAGVSSKTLNWGIGTGSRRDFQNALVASLRPLMPLLRVVLADDDLVVLNSITIKGADGYNTAIIPILEALGCDSHDIKSYPSYEKSSKGDGVLDNVLEPVFDLLGDVADKPVKTLIDRLPNIIYFLESGSLEKCINNLLLPVTSILNRVPGVFDLNIDTASLTSELNVDSFVEELLKNSGVKIADFDIKQLATLGEAVKLKSKSTLDGKKQEYTYIEADRNAIIITLLNVVAKTIKLPGNENLLMGSMGGSGAMNFDASAMTAQFADMSDSEFVEWLYNLFFKERVQIEIVEKEDYAPTIIYKPQEKSKTPLYVFLGYLSACVVVGTIIFFNRKRLYI